MPSMRMYVANYIFYIFSCIIKKNKMFGRMLQKFNKMDIMLHKNQCVRK